MAPASPRSASTSARSFVLFVRHSPPSVSLCIVYFLPKPALYLQLRDLGDNLPEDLQAPVVRVYDDVRVFGVERLEVDHAFFLHVAADEEFPVPENNADVAGFDGILGEEDLVPVVVLGLHASAIDSDDSEGSGVP